MEQGGSGRATASAGARLLRARARSAAGRAAEQAAERHLVRLGLLILGRNVRVGRYEIDLVAREGAVVAIVEVRTRGEGAWLGPLESVDSGKRSRLRLAGERLWRDVYRRDPGLERMRFDLAAVRFVEGDEPLVEYVRAVF